MEAVEYLAKESELIVKSDFIFKDCKKIITNWFALKNGKITEHRSLANAMQLRPEYLILERKGDYINAPKLTLYYDKDLNDSAYLPFDNWKLYDSKPYFNGKQRFYLEDPLQVRKDIDLGIYFPNVPAAIQKYLKFESFEDYAANQSSQLNIEKDTQEFEPIVIKLESGSSYTITIQ